MKRKMICILICLLLASWMALPVSAGSSLPRIVDNADLLTGQEEQLLEDAALEFAEMYSLSGYVQSHDMISGLHPGSSLGVTAVRPPCRITICTAGQRKTQYSFHL